MKSVRVPKGRDPFVNARPVPLGNDSKGRERFWISSCNGVSGSIGAVVNEEGAFRLYRLSKPHIMYCYSAAPEDEKTLWLCVGLSQVACLDLKTGVYAMYPTGADPAFVCCGGRLDLATGKFFALGYLDRGGTDGTTAVSFNVRTRKAVIHRDVAPDQFMYSFHQSNDGTYIGTVVCPGASLVRWDPRAETVEHIRMSDQHPGLKAPAFFIADEQDQLYFPDHGWYSLRTQAFLSGGPKPEREVTWFDRRGKTVIGCESDANGNTSVSAWDMETGKVRRVTTIPACYTQGILLTQSGKLVSVNIYGEFRRHDLATGRMELFRRLPSDSVQPVDHVLRLNPDRLIGSNFITQRFWEINLRTGKGYDCGKAAPGGGQVQHFWKIGAKVYLNSYGSGNLLEYDPARHPNFPENPHVVAEPPESMRPVAFADDGRHLYYASNRHYGHLGTTVTKYDTRTGAYICNVNPVEGQNIHSLWLEKRRSVLLGHTSFRADCDSRPPSTDITSHVRLRAGDLSVLVVTPLPNTMHAGGILGPLDAGRLLCQYHCILEGGPRRAYLAAIDRETFRLPDVAQLRPAPEGVQGILYAGRPGLFVLHRDKCVELWDMRKWRCLRLLKRDPQVRRMAVQGRAVYLVRARDIMILEDALR